MAWRRGVFAVFALLVPLSAASAKAPPPSPYQPLTALPHPGELYFNIDEERAKGIGRACSEAIEQNSFPPEPPAQVVTHTAGDNQDAIGQRFTSNLMAATAYWAKLNDPPANDQVAGRLDRAKSELLAWARGHGFGKFRPNDRSEWGVFYNTMPAVLLAVNVLENRQMLTPDEKKDIFAWLKELVNRTYVGKDDPDWRPGVEVDGKINNKNTTERLDAMLWAIENNDVHAFNDAVTDGYVRFLQNMKSDGSLIDANRGMWALDYTSFNLDAALVTAAAAAHEGVDLFDMEIDGKSISTAVKFYLDAADDNAVIAKYARANAGMEWSGKFDGKQVQWLEVGNRTGVSYIGWYDIYIDHFPNSENARRLRILRDRSFSISREAHHYLIDFNFGVTSCFFGDMKNQPPPPARPGVSLTYDKVTVTSSSDPNSFFIHLLKAKVGERTPRLLNLWIYADRYPEDPTYPHRLFIQQAFSDAIDEETLRANYGDCPASSHDGNIQLSFGRMSQLNDCLLDKMGPTDREIFETVLAQFPKLLEAALAQPDNKAARQLADLYRASF
ncbi:MAG TPA: alginate lyase family protein [Bauldia sp.]|nr:alginate lyase family protein [Bauldia sp.]